MSNQSLRRLQESSLGFCSFLERVWWSVVIQGQESHQGKNFPLVLVCYNKFHFAPLWGSHNNLLHLIYGETLMTSRPQFPVKLHLNTCISVIVALQITATDQPWMMEPQLPCHLFFDWGQSK